MSTAIELRRDIEGCELPHDSFVRHRGELQHRIEDAINGFAPRLEWVVGPSRVGKTMLLNALARDYPEERINNVRRVPVLRVPVPASISSKLLPISVLSALGMPLPQRGLTSGVMFNRMMEQLRLANTKVILWEEASHLVEPGSRVSPRASGDWFKEVYERLSITQILFGVPRLQHLFDSNEQLKYRASARREFRPYSFLVEAEARAFSACVQTYATLFAKAGWPFNIAFDSLVKNCYLVSGGLIGVLSRFMQELACQLNGQAPRSVTLADCARVVAAIESVGHPSFPPFSKELVLAVELNQAHSYVLKLSGMATQMVLFESNSKAASA